MLVSQKRIVVEDGHCDPSGFVYFTQFMRWFDACTTALFKNAGLPLPALLKEQSIVGIPLVKVEAQFFLPSTCGDELLAESTVARFGKSSFVIRHLFSKRSVLAVEGFETRVWALRVPDDPQRIQSRPLPPELVERLSISRTVVASI
jgi:4-hydroxybenzoyl-CoA thioesterase